VREDGDRHVAGRMAASIRGYREAAAPYQRFLYVVAALFLASAIVHGLAFALDDRPWEGPLSWRKPLLFSLSFALLTASVAWVLTFLPRRPLAGWGLGALLALAGIGEVALIAMQTWRGRASHFNLQTPFDAQVFGLMGQLIIVVAVTIVLLTVWAFVSLRAPSSIAWSIKLGLLLLIAGQAVGGIILGEGFRQEEVGRLTSPVVFGDAGNMNVPHAVALHGLQVLPLLGWLLTFSRWDTRREVVLVALAAAGYGTIVGASIWLAATGRSLFPLSGPGGLIALGATVVASAYVVALYGLMAARTEPAPTPS